MAVTSGYNNIGAVYEEQAKLPEAPKALQKSLDIKINIHGQDHLHVAQMYGNIGVVLKQQREAS